MNDDEKEKAMDDYAERFGYLWPSLVDLLKEMGVPFALTVQFAKDEDAKRCAAFHLVPGMDPRILFAAVLARDGIEGLSKLIPGLGKFQKMNLTEAEGNRQIAELEAGDMKMQKLKMPEFMDSMRDMQSGPEDPDG